MSDFEIDILIEDERWSTDLHTIEALAARAIHAAIAQMKTGGFEPYTFSELSLAFVDDDKIQYLNRTFRDKDKPTNVISFPGMEIDGFRPLLGDVVLAYETVRDEASQSATPLEDHTTHLIVHGFLHLHGFDHQDDVEAVEMEALEIATLQGLGIANPYVKEVKL